MNQEEEEEEEEEKPKKATRAVPSNPCPFPTSARDIQEYLDQAECRYIKWKRALTSFKNETNVQETAKKKVLAKSLEDMAILSMCQYRSACFTLSVFFLSLFGFRSFRGDNYI